MSSISEVYYVIILDQNDIVVSRQISFTFPTPSRIHELMEFEAYLHDVEITELSAKIDKRYIVEE